MVQRSGEFLSQVSKNWDSPFGNPHIHTSWKKECASAATGDDPLDCKVMAYCSGSDESEDENNPDGHRSRAGPRSQAGKPSLIGAAASSTHFAQLENEEPEEDEIEDGQSSVFTEGKAGMFQAGGIDKKQLKKQVLEAQKDSKFFKKQQRVDAVTGVRIEKLLAKKKSLSEAELAAGGREASRRAAELEGYRNLWRVWVITVYQANSCFQQICLYV